MKNAKKAQVKMKNEAVLVLDDSKYLGSNLPVTQADFDDLSNQRKMLKSFVSQQLKSDVDFGIIPGTPKPSLFKPGAEKLNRLFGLGAKFTLMDKEFDRPDNFAMYTYKCEIVHLKSGRVIAECEGSCNSQETKYKEKSVYEGKGQYRKYKGKEATPIADIANTLMKMSQKRAMVGATILACAASDFFTQDLEDDESIIVQERDVNAGASVQAGPQDDDRNKKIEALVSSFQKIGVGVTAIKTRYNLSDDKALDNLTDDQLRELATIGKQISKDGADMRSFFPLKNQAPGAKS